MVLYLVAELLCIAGGKGLERLTREDGASRCIDSSAKMFADKGFASISFTSCT
jgi:hypothetical protein